METRITIAMQCVLLLTGWAASRAGDNFTGDGQVDLEDFGILKTPFGFTTAP